MDKKIRIDYEYNKILNDKKDDYARGLAKTIAKVCGLNEKELYSSFSDATERVKIFVINNKEVKIKYSLMSKEEGESAERVYYREARKKKKFLKATAQFFEKYNIKNLDDLLDFNEEITLAGVVSKLGKTNKTVEEKKSALRKRLGLKENYEFDEAKLADLRNKINGIFKTEIYNEVLEKNNIKDFFKLFGYETNIGNVIYLAKKYKLNPRFLAYDRIEHDFGKGKETFLLYDDQILCMKVLRANESVMEDLIFEASTVKTRYNSMEEKLFDLAFTRYLAILTAKEMQKDNTLVLTDKDYRYSGWMRDTSAEDYFPYMESFIKSPYCKFAMICKMNGDYSPLKKEMGRDLYKKFMRFFRLPCRDEIGAEQIAKFNRLFDSSDNRE